MIDRGRHNVLGVKIDAVDYEGAVERIAQAAKQRQTYAVSALAVHGVMTGVLDERHRFRLNRFDMIVPDGQPVRWGLNLLHGTKLKERVYGPTLMLKVCERAAADGLPIFLFGGKPELLEALRARLMERFPDLEIAGMLASRFRQLSEEERAEVVKTICDSGAAITFIGLGCPRQEVWAYEFRDALPMPLLAVGAAFNFHAGLLKQAPPVLQRWGLEWFYRFYQEPTRLWKRYAFLNPLYLTLLFLQVTRLYTLDPAQCKEPTDQLLYG